MERELGKWLKLAHKWGAVMLIDEADVFLEKRMESDVKRNSLVSGKPSSQTTWSSVERVSTSEPGTNDDSLPPRNRVLSRYPVPDHQPRGPVRRCVYIQDTYRDPLSGLERRLPTADLEPIF